MQRSWILNEDVIIEILLRLPVRSICRLRCASKQFLFITTQLYFLLDYCSAAAANPNAFILAYNFNQVEIFSLDSNNSSPISDPTLSFLDCDGTPFEFVDCCNGLILCRRFLSDDCFLSVCNPTTHQHDVIPAPDDAVRATFSLAFDPTRSPNYRVVGIGRNRMYKYSSEVESWKLLDVQTSTLGFRKRSLYCKGSLFWWSADEGEGIHALDVEGENLRKVALPPKQEMVYMYFGASGGRLQFISGLRWRFTTHFDVLEMEEELGGWSLLYNVNLYPINRVYPGRLEISVIGFFRGEGGDMLLLSIPRRIVAYYVRDGVFREICGNLPRDKYRQHNYHWSQAYPLAHSLFPMNTAARHQDWVCWKPWHDRLLISLMVHCYHNGQKNKVGFKKDAWNDMVRRFNETTQLNYGVSHLKNRLKSYKKEYQKVSKILSNEGFEWNPEQQRVTAGDAEWSQYLIRCPKAVVYERKQVLFRELDIICSSICKKSHEDTEEGPALKRKKRGGKNSLTSTSISN